MWLGIDLGTSGVKAVVIDDASTVVDQAVAPLSISRPHPLWSEQDPEEWWRATCAAVGALAPRNRAAVRGMGLSGQMHGAVLLDGGDHVVRPAILWNDGRAHAECAMLEAAEPQSRVITGNIAMPGFTAPKLLWVQRHEPAAFSRIATVLLPKDYLRLRLTGDHASDMSDSAGTLWLDVAERRWSAAMLAASGLSEQNMPKLLEGCEPSGRLGAGAAAELGLPQVPVAAGAGDNAAGAIGAGVVAPGDALLSLGTSGVVFAVSDGFAPNPAKAVHAFCHALPGRWHQMAVVLSAASCIPWAAALGGHADVAAAIAAAEASSEQDLPIFLPYLSGERTPHNDPHAKGVWFGLTDRTTRAELMRSVLEGTAFALADGTDALRAAGTGIERLAVLGGGSRSRLWGEILASALGTHLEYRQGAEVGPALGAARLARMALTGEAAEVVCTPGTLIGSAEPRVELAERLGERRALFQQIYSSLQPLFDPERPS